jgi:hypothetical protein
VKYLGQPTQYGIGRGSQLSCLVILDHGRKTSPPGVIDNYIGWLTPKLHGLDDPKYPSLVGVLIINTNLPIPSKWRRRIAVVPDKSVACRIFTWRFGPQVATRPRRRVGLCASIRRTVKICVWPFPVACSWTPTS